MTHLYDKIIYYILLSQLNNQKTIMLEKSNTHLNIDTKLFKFYKKNIYKSLYIMQLHILKTLLL